MGRMTQARIFIGSSVEGLPVARFVQDELTHDCEPIIWNQNVFQPNSNTLWTLIEVARTYDFAVFVFTPDDKTWVRGTERMSARDNVVFEFGLFLGSMGTDRAFFLKDRDQTLGLPTDLAGITPLTYASGAMNRQAALGPACNSIRRQVQALGMREQKRLDALSRATEGVTAIE